MKLCLATALGIFLTSGFYGKAATPTAGHENALQISAVLPETLAPDIKAGRLFIYFAPTAESEPRFQSNTSIFGLDAHNVNAGQHLIVPVTTAGAAEKTLRDLAPGDYYVQAIFNVLTEFHRADGHVIWAHMDQWEGQNFARSPGNLYSTPQKIHIGPGAPAAIVLSLENVIKPIEVPADTVWVKRIKFQSALLSKFWGRPMYLGATILLPKDYDLHPDVHYPVVYIQNHFSIAPPFGFNPAVTSEETKGSSRKRSISRDTAKLDKGAGFSEAWQSAEFPRLILVTFQHPTPYFDDSYGVNSPNCGPYGDAILQELMPALEAQFRMIKAEYARVLTGSSTGGWGSLALQLYYPEVFGGAWAFSPDPVDFRLYYGGVNIYDDENAFIEKTTPGLEGGATMNRRSSQRAAVLGTQEGRFEWWKHTSVGPDGYPLPVWDLQTGKIDRAVVNAMRANNFDLREYLSRQWPKIGSKLVGKLHVHAAAVDSFYSNFAVRLLDEFMQSTQNPHDAGSFQYGPPSSRHGWQPMTNVELLREIAQHIAARAPASAKPTAWHY
jgi:Putative esterase